MDGLTSARSRVEKILAFNRERNPTWHVFTCVMEAEALEAADAADLRCRRGSSLGPLDGITVAIKDNIDVRGQATSAGIRHYRNAIAAADAPLVRQLRAAGSVIVGKTNIPGSADARIPAIPDIRQAARAAAPRLLWRAGCAR